MGLPTHHVISRWVAGAALGSAALHIFVLLVLSRPPSEGQNGSLHAPQQAHPVLMLQRPSRTAVYAQAGRLLAEPAVAPRPAADQAPQAPEDASNASQTPATSELAPAHPWSRADAVDADIAAAMLAAPSAGIHYWTSDEVDTPATPASDWRVQTEQIAPGQVFRFSAQVFVSREGRIDRIELLDPTQRGADPTLLLDSLKTTPMQPARRQGVAVASVRVVEFQIRIEHPDS